MVDRLHLDSQEREILANIGSGLNNRKADQWYAARLALARSLLVPETPDPKNYQRRSKQIGGVELHAQQFTGEGKGIEDDLTDVFRAILSIYENKNLFDDDAAFDDALQKHVRRGLHDIDISWKRETDFFSYLLQEMYFGSQLDHEASSDDDVNDLTKKVERTFGQLGIGAAVLEIIKGPRLSRLTLELSSLDDLEKLRKSLGKIEFSLGLNASTLTLAVAPGERRLHLDIPRPSASWRTVTWTELQPALSSADAANMALPICLGTDVLGQPFLIDLAEAPHLFVGGTTGSGKSMCLHTILLSLMNNKTARTKLVLIDPKAVEFTSYIGSSQVHGGGPIITADDAFDALNSLVGEMEERQNRLKALDARNISEANEKGADLPRIVVVVDELGDLFMTRREIETPLIRLAQKARSAGIHLVLATQRPEAATFPGLLRSNIPSRIALTVQKSAESRIILDETGAELLLMKGDMLVRSVGRTTARAHGCRVDPADIVSAMRLA